MKTLKQLKALINFAQTDEVFKEYVLTLEKSDIIKVEKGDISGSNVSDSFYERIAAVYGIQLDDELNPLNLDEDN